MAMTYQDAIAYLRNRFGYARRFARIILAECRNGFPFASDPANRSLYYRSDSRYELIAE